MATPKTACLSYSKKWALKKKHPGTSDLDQKIQDSLQLFIDETEANVKRMDSIIDYIKSEGMRIFMAKTAARACLLEEEDVDSLRMRPILRSALKNFDQRPDSGQSLAQENGNNTTLQVEEEALADSLANMTSQLETSGLSLVEANGDVATLRGEKETLEESVANMTTQLEASGLSLAQANDNVATLRGENETLVESVAAITSHRNTLQNELLRSQNTVSSITAERDTMQGHTTQITSRFQERLYVANEKVFTSRSDAQASPVEAKKRDGHYEQLLQKSSAGILTSSTSSEDQPEHFEQRMQNAQRDIVLLAKSKFSKLKEELKQANANAANMKKWGAFLVVMFLGFIALLLAFNFRSEATAKGVFGLSSSSSGSGSLTLADGNASRGAAAIYGGDSTIILLPLVIVAAHGNLFNNGPDGNNHSVDWNFYEDMENVCSVGRNGVCDTDAHSARLPRGVDIDQLETYYRDYSTLKYIAAMTAGYLVYLM
eukprot:CAMPEP_0172306606 /NCGR_PEP_ID=MMETSP1058-20130122/7654_1 /TAXON_ID=83371 /ORGANISM="Detonula confervacea, Strain CCMP 353" /LENGTH=487 /DNA_ID=CAMNT_0013018555 /DNA_START=510 /DNA_END=1973 /DNA_ORIENTATION=+